MSANKTQATSASVEQFLDAVEPPQRQAEARVITDLMRRVTGQEPVMWGTSMIGFGDYHYVYESGRKGDASVVGFAPRKTQITIYLMDGFEPYEEELASLGPYSKGKSCLHLKKFDAVNLDVLADIVGKSYRATTAR